MRSAELELERAQIHAERNRRQFDACEPENRLVARTLEQKLETALAAVIREQSKLAAVESARPMPLTDPERKALATLARDLPRLWDAETTTHRDRKLLLRTLISEVIVTVHTETRQADVEIAWEGGARTELAVKINGLVPGRHRLGEEAIELIRRLAEHHDDRQIAAILTRQGYRTISGLPLTQARVQRARLRAHIPAAPPPDPNSELITIEQAAAQLNVSIHTVRRWINRGLLPGEQTLPGAPWRIRLNAETRARFVPDVPHGFVPLKTAARLLGCARQTVLHKVQRGELQAIQVTTGRRKGLRIKVPNAGLDHLLNQ